MSKKSSKTSHVLNLITNRIGMLEDGTRHHMPEDPDDFGDDFGYDGPEISVSHVAEMNIDHASVQTTIIPDDLTREDLQAILDASDPEAFSPFYDNDDEDGFPLPENSTHGMPSPARKEAPAQVRPDAPSNTPKSPVAPATQDPDFDPVADRIRQELENHLAASISPMTLQDFSDPREQRSVELPLSSPITYPTMVQNTSKEGNMIDDYMIEHEDFVYVNIMEELVRQEYEILMDRMDMCKCKRCRNDVLALALNTLPPKYVVTKKGYLVTKLASYDMQYHADILSAITSACLRVKKYPNHEEDIAKKQSE